MAPLQGSEEIKLEINLKSPLDLFCDWDWGQGLKLCSSH